MITRILKPWFGKDYTSRFTGMCFSLSVSRFSECVCERQGWFVQNGRCLRLLPPLKTDINVEGCFIYL